MPSMLVASNIVQNGSRARLIADDLAWGVGAIQPRAEYASPKAQEALLQAVLDCLEPVAEAETVYSACTDGRLPLKLLSGESIPVREQAVGADMVSAFYIAEVLGARFYRDVAAPVAERVREVAGFLKANGLQPSTHLGCGAAAGFVAISQNAVRFGRDPRYRARLEALLPEGIFDLGLHDALIRGTEERLAKELYDGLSAETFLNAVDKASGKHAIAELRDDGRGVHGHVEELIIRIRVPGRAINGAKLAELTAGREVFGVNDPRLDRLARLFGRGEDEDYRLARLALEVFTSSGHGTLAKNLPTYIITAEQ